MVHFFLALPIVLIVLLLYRHWPDPGGLVWFPVVVAIQLLFTTALALGLAALTVHFRDIRDILTNVLMLWFFTTPIIYFYDQKEVQPFKWLFNLNPFTHLAISYQEILFFNGPFGHWKWLLVDRRRVPRRVRRRLLAVRPAAAIRSPRWYERD